MPDLMRETKVKSRPRWVDLNNILIQINPGLWSAEDRGFIELYYRHATVGANSIDGGKRRFGIRRQSTATKPMDVPREIGWTRMTSSRWELSFQRLLPPSLSSPVG